MFWLHIVREEETAIFAYIFPAWLGASANFGVFRRLLASTIIASGKRKVAYKLYAKIFENVQLLGFDYKDKFY